MSSHIAILDIGKTNKKALVFDQDYRVVYIHIDTLEEATDEDGFPCEDIVALTSWAIDQVNYIVSKSEFDIKAINFSAYGASFVLLDQEGKVVAPLYNYLKPLNQNIKDQFFKAYGGESRISLGTSSPSLGMLNSGLQLYRLKYENEPAFSHVHAALHLPQYFHYLFTHHFCSEMTSIGCHTMLWDYHAKVYHEWVREEKLGSILPPLMAATDVLPVMLLGKSIMIGTGLHDSSAALIPYLLRKSESFILLSTGTWSIALNPFDATPLTSFELAQDCLCYLTYEGKPVKASRLFLGHEYEEQLHKLSIHFGIEENYFLSLKFETDYLNYQSLESDLSYIGSQGLLRSGFEKRTWSEFGDASVAYHILIYDLVRMQKRSIRLIQQHTITTLYIDGGFSKNAVFMQLMAKALPELRVFAAELPQASAIGAAMAIHPYWNTADNSLPTVELIEYPVL
jgi:sugar (pentulose or hexulose) kinase